MPELLTAEAAVHLLGSDRVKLAQCIRGAYERYTTERATAGPVGVRSRACLIYDYASENAEGAFADAPRVRIVRRAADDSLRAIVFDDRAIVRFKKLDDDLKIRAIPTGLARLWDAQEPLEGFPDATNLVAGYQLDELGQLGALLVTCSLHGRVLWAHPLDDAEHGHGATPVPLTIAPSSAPSGTRIVVQSETSKSFERTGTS